MPAAQGLYLTTQFEITADNLVREYSEAVYHGKRFSGPVDDLFRLELQIRRVGYGKDNCFNPLERPCKVIPDPNVLQA